MSPDLTTITVRIYGWDYTLKVEPQEVERAKALADYLDQRMQQIATRSTTADTLKIAIRAALTIIDELFDAREQLEKALNAPPPPAEESSEFQKRLDELKQKIDSQLQAL